MSTMLTSGGAPTGKLSRRNFLRAAATGVAGALLVACAPPASLGGTNNAEQPAAGAAKPSVLVFECCWDAEHIEAGKKLYNQYRSAHPDVDVIDFWPAPGDDWTTKLLAKVAAGDQLDIIWWCASHHKFAEEGRLLDLRDLAEGDSDFKLDDFQSVGVDFCFDKPGRGRAMWGLPTNYATVLLWYNKKMFDNAGVAYPDSSWTYQSMLEAAQQLTKDTNGDGTPDEWGVSIPNDGWYYEPVLNAFGGGIVEISQDDPCLLSMPESVEALQWLQDLLYKHKVAPTPADMAGLGSQAMLISDKLAMGFWPEWAQFEFLPAHADAGLEYGVTLLPTGPAGRVTNYWAGITSVTSTAKSPEAAWDVAKFIVSDDYQRMMTVTLPESPAARISTTEFRFKEYDKYPDDRSALIESPQYGRQYYVVDRYGKEMGDIVTPGLDPMWEGKEAPAALVDDICAKVVAKADELKAAAGSASMGIC
ncbi:MAG TPA: extracellular solute-binding protein, partial [Caldilineaceae bacterium]|nr:extracellular solute-binding protein [Caldilineaceae bacterium]